MEHKKALKPASKRRWQVISLGGLAIVILLGGSYWLAPKQGQAISAQPYMPADYQFLPPISEYASVDLVGDVQGIAITREDVQWAHTRASGSRSAPVGDMLTIRSTEVATQKFLAHAAVMDGLHETPSFQAFVKERYINLLAKKFLARELDAAVRVNKAEVEAYIVAHPQLFDGRKHFAFDVLDIDQADFDKLDITAITAATSHTEVEKLLQAQDIAFVRAPFSLYAEQLPVEISSRMQRFEDGQRSFFMQRGGVAQIVRVLGVRSAPQSGSSAFNLAKLKLTEQKRRELLAEVETTALDRLTKGAGLALAIRDHQQAKH